LRGGYGYIVIKTDRGCLVFRLPVDKDRLIDILERHYGERVLKVEEVASREGAFQACQ